MFKIFLGSTFKDLHEHRAAVQAAINRRDDCKAVVMEEFGARAGSPKEVCLEIVGACDLYVGLIGHCYGHVPDGEAVSITEAEYEAAVAKRLPRVVFLANEHFTPPAHIRESDDEYRKMQDFRGRLAKAETLEKFDNDKGALAARVGEALSRELPKLQKRAEQPAAMPVFLPKRGLCVGRKEEVARLCEAVLADEPEPVVVLGPPGIGKSKVTVAALHDPAVKTRFGERRWFVPLETAPEPEAILGQVALRIGVPPGPELAARVFAALAAGPGLLVLDNTETPWWRDSGGTEAVLEEIAQAPELALVCSVRGHRAPGRPRFGTTILVPGLGEPAARALFLARAGDRHARSALLSGLLADMDGVPLAIELLAAQVRADEMGLERVAKAWRAKRTDLLASQPDAAHRLDSYEVSLALSLASPRMTEASRCLYATLGRLPAGLQLNWIEVLMPSGGEAAAEVLGELGLVFDAGGRLRMLAPVREHAADQELAESLDRQLIGYAIDLACEAGPEIGEAEGSHALALLSTEWANLECLISKAFTAAPASAIDAAVALTNLSALAGIGTNRLLLAAERAAWSAGDDLRTATTNLCLAEVALRDHDLDFAQQRLGLALPLFRKVRSISGEAACVLRLGDIALERPESNEATQRYEQALSLFRKDGNAVGEATCIWSLGRVALMGMDQEVARQRFEQALPLYQRARALQGEANCLKSLGDIALAHSDYAVARQRYEDALLLHQKVGHVLHAANCAFGLGDVALACSDHKGARHRYEAALSLYRQVGDVLGEADCIQGLGDLALAEGECVPASKRFAEALALYRRIEKPYSIGWALVRLTRLAEGEARAGLVAQARAAWESINRPDLVAGLEREFGAG